MRGRAEAFRQLHRSGMTQGWHTAVIGRAGTIPSLAEVLGDPIEPQTDEEMTFELAAFAAATVGA